MMDKLHSVQSKMQSTPMLLNLVPPIYGVISVYYEHYRVWRGLNQYDSNTPLGSNEADAICRQMGYTGSITGTIVTRNASDYPFDNC